MFGVMLIVLFGHNMSLKEEKMRVKIAKSAIVSAVALTVGLASFAASAATEVQWWHAMGGVNGERVNKIAEDFNATQSDYKVVPVYKGNYTETMTSAIAAFRAKQQPHIVQVLADLQGPLR